MVSEGLFALTPGTVGYWLRKRNYGMWLGNLGCKFSIGQYSRIQQPKAVFISDNVSFNDRIWIAANENFGEIYFEKNTLVGPNCVFHTGNHVFSKPNEPIKTQGHVFKPIRIEEDVWIAANVTVLQGVTIGKGSIVAAGSVVNKDIPPFKIAAGIPAKIIGNR
tara:strand:- start:206 stop:694 length:489 start_codon:yes stop_codon:yes gene_type:complete